MERESDLYSLWVRAARTGAAFRCRDGRNVVVIARGVRNDGAGPDFNGAVLLIDGRMHVGDVEMHLRESDWFAHRHQLDDAYNSVILHVIAAESGVSLDLPTVLASELPGQAGAPDSPESVPAGLPAELLAELSWSRLLRRATEIIRADPALPDPIRIRRAFILRAFDCLGYAGNREPMGQVARWILEREDDLAGASLERFTVQIFRASGLQCERMLSMGEKVIDPSLLALIPDAGGVCSPVWRYDVRRENAPERRLWGGAILLHRLYGDGLLDIVVSEIRSGSFRNIERHLTIRSGRETLIGAGRGREIIINALLPVAVAAGLLARDRELVEGGCRLYREFPSLASNRIVRNVESRYLNGAELSGGFWQQGAIEFHQRYLNADRSRLSFIAEGRNAQVQGLTPAIAAHRRVA
ncbi:MAG: hypothetical protein JWQ98_3600 [Chlorobi bacterium]|nr:hypothetical protein [Chlorobiota bacterium]